MSQTTLNDFKDDVSLFIEAGYVAIKQLDGKSARRLFETAQKLDPENVNPRIGIGYIHLNKLEINEAIAIFDKIVKEHPEDQLARMYLGICYMLVAAKQKEGIELVRDAMEKTDDETVVNLGKVSLEWCEKDLKKMKLPF